MGGTHGISIGCSDVWADVFFFNVYMRMVGKFECSGLWCRCLQCQYILWYTQMVRLQLAHRINCVLIYWYVGQCQKVRWISVGYRISFFCCRSSWIGRWRLVGGSLLDFCHLRWCACISCLYNNIWIYCLCFWWVSMSSIGVFGLVTSASEYVSTMATVVQLCFECVDDVN